MSEKKRTFIRGLWGITDAADGVQSPRLATKVYSDIRIRIERYPKIEPCINYTFGKKNNEFLRSLGLETVMLSEEPLVNWTGASGPRDCDSPSRRRMNQRGRLAWGLSLWRHKLECIRRAFEMGFEEIVWLDFDNKRLRPLPEDFWERLGSGQPVQAQLRNYRNPHCSWRATGKGKLCHGAWLYLRDLRILEDIIRVHETRFPTCTDEVAISWVIEKMMGGWKGVDAYYEMGFAPYCFANRLSTRKPPSEDIIFIEGFAAHERELERRNKPALPTRHDLWLARKMKHQQERAVQRHKRWLARRAARRHARWLARKHARRMARRHEAWRARQAKKAERAAQPAISEKPDEKPGLVRIRLNKRHLIDGVLYLAGQRLPVERSVAEFLVKQGIAR